MEPTQTTLGERSRKVGVLVLSLLLLLAINHYLCVLFCEIIPAARSHIELLRGKDYDNITSPLFLLSKLSHDPIGIMVVLAANYNETVLFIHAVVFFGLFAWMSRIRRTSKIVLLVSGIVLFYAFAEILCRKFGGGLMGFIK